MTEFRSSADLACDRWARECIVEPTPAERLSFKMGYLMKQRELIEALIRPANRSVDPSYDPAAWDMQSR